MTGQIIQLTMPGMANKPGRRKSTPSEFRDAMFERTRKAREDRGLDWPEIAALLTEAVGRPISADTYRKWESESLMPHDVILAFCDITLIHPGKYLSLDEIPQQKVQPSHLSKRRHNAA